MKNLIVTAILSTTAITGFCSDNSDSAIFYLKKATELSHNRKNWEAEKSFQKAVAFNPLSIDIHIEYGNFLADQRKSHLASAQFAKALEININHPVALQRMTELSFQQHHWNDVVVYGSKVAQSGTSNDVKFMMGKSYYELENYGQSQKFLKEALTQNPKNLQAVTLLGKVLVELNDYKQAIAVYNQTLQLDPDNNQLIYELGVLYYSLVDEKSAVRYFELALEKGYKADLDFYENLGMAQLSQDLKKGVQTLEKVLVNKPGDADILFQIAQAYYKVEKFQEAATVYHRVYENDPSNSRALYMTGVSYQKKGDKDKGVAYCEQAIRMDPNLAQLKSQKFSF